MALIGNYSLLNKSFERPIGGQVASGNRSSFNQTGGLRNWGKQTGLDWSLAALPQGHAAGGAWLLPRDAGGMTSRNAARMSVSSAGAGAMGVPIVGSAEMTFAIDDAVILPLDSTSPLRTGSASFSISLADAAGQLISSGVGSASFSISMNTPLLTATIEGQGTSSFSITTNTPTLGAEASMLGTSEFTFSTGASALPLNDASPLRTAAASFSFSGALTPYARGFMVGSTVDTSVMTPALVATAVWNDAIRTLTSGVVTGGSGPTAEEVATAVWDKVL